MMTMYLTPYHRIKSRRLIPGDQIARNIGHIHSDVHVPMDILEEKDSFVIYATVPGLTAEDIEIEIVKDTVTIRGDFEKADEKDINFLRKERPVGNFHRSFQFGVKLDSGKANAGLENGILTLRIPKVKEALPKSIKVNTN